jgi:hypothetical protein
MLAATAQVAAVAADGLGEGAHLQRHPRLAAAEEAAAPAPAQHADAVGVVGHQPGVEALGQIRQVFDRRQVPVHAEDAVGEDQGATRLRAVLLQELLRAIEVVVSEGQGAGAAHAGPGVDAGVGELVQQHQVAGAHQGGNDAQVRQVARPEDTGGGRLLEPGQTRLECLVQGVVAGHQTRGAGADAQGLHRADRRRLDLRFLGEVQVVVAAERHESAATAAHVDAPLPIGLHQMSAQGGPVDALELLAGEAFE